MFSVGASNSYRFPVFLQMSVYLMGKVLESYPSGFI